MSGRSIAVGRSSKASKASTARKTSGVVALALASLAGFAGVANLGCRRAALDDQDQVGAAAGEVMASLDESLDGRATTAFRTPERLRGPLWRRALDAIEPSAYAAACFPSTFSACDAGVRTRTYDHCSVGAATLDGTATLTFTRAAACALVSEGDAVTRTAQLTLTGPYGGTLTVTSPGGGQTLTKTASGFSYSVAGMERVLEGPGGRKLFDVATHTTAPLVVTGSSRSDLTIVSGTLAVEHKLAGYTVSLAASNLAWSATCNCAVSGKLEGTVSGSKHAGQSAVVELTGCGRADVTIGDDTESITLDRCAGI
jgi:hypothetical protein